MNHVFTYKQPKPSDRMQIVFRYYHYVKWPQELYVGLVNWTPELYAGLEAWPTDLYVGLDKLPTETYASLIVWTPYLHVGLVRWPPELYVGPSGVRALPLAAGINVGGHYKWHFFLLLLFLSFFRLIANFSSPVLIS